MTTDADRLDLLRYRIDGTVLHLFRNDADPSESSVLADFVECPEEGGYAPVLLPWPEWTVYAPVPLPWPEWTAEDFRATYSHVWELRGYEGEIHGWFLTRGEIVVTGKRFGDKPVVVGPAGGRVEVTCWVEM